MPADDRRMDPQSEQLWREVWRMLSISARELRRPHSDLNREDLAKIAQAQQNALELLADVVEKLFRNSYFKS